MQRRTAATVCARWALLQAYARRRATSSFVQGARAPTEPQASCRDARAFTVEGKPPEQAKDRVTAETKHAKEDRQQEDTHDPHPHEGTDLRRFAEGDQVIGTRVGFDDTPLKYPLPPERLEGGSATD